MLLASLERGKLDMFMGRARLDITKDVMVGDNPPKTFLEAFGQALNFEAIS